MRERKLIQRRTHEPRRRRPGFFGAPVALGVRPGSERPRIPRNEAVLGSASEGWKLCRSSMRVPLRRSE